MNLLAIGLLAARVLPASPASGTSVPGVWHSWKRVFQHGVPKKSWSSICIGYTLHIQMIQKKTRPNPIQYHSRIIHQNLGSQSNSKKKNTEHWNLSISKRSRIPNHDNQAHLAKSSFTYRIQRIWVFYRLSVIRINEAREKTTTFHGQYPAPLRYALDSFLKRFLTWFKRVWYIPSAAGFFYGSRVITSWISQKNCNIDWYKMVPSSLILTANQQVFQSKPG